MAQTKGVEGAPEIKVSHMGVFERCFFLHGFSLSTRLPTQGYDSKGTTPSCSLWKLLRIGLAALLSPSDVFFCSFHLFSELDACDRSWTLTLTTLKK